MFVYLIINKVVNLQVSINQNAIIDKYAKEGWRLVQVFPMNYNSHGKPMEYEVIFERKIDDK